MASGIFYGGAQPLQRDDTLLRMLEGERARSIAAQKERADKMAEHRLTLFDGFDKIDAQGDFLNASVSVMDQVKDERVKAFNKYENGEMSEKDWLLYKSKSGQIPSLINGAYDNFEAKQKEIVAGDEVLNAHSINALTVAGHGLDLKYDADSKQMMVEANILEPGQKEPTRKKMTMNEWNGWVGQFKSVPPLGDVGEDVMKFGDDFEASEKQTASETGTRRMKGFSVGDSQSRFDQGFVSKYGTKNDGNNPYVLKYQGTTPYDEAWEKMYGIAKSRTPDKDIATVKTPSTKAQKTGNEDIDKMNFTVLTEKGTGGGDDPVLTSIDTGDGVIDGIGAGFKLSDSSQRIEIDASGLEGVPEGVSENIKVNSFFIADNGDIYIKGSAEKLDPVYQMLKAKNNKSEADQKKLEALDIFFEKRRRGVDFIKIKGTAATDFRANVWNGRSAEEIKKYLNSKTNTVEESTFDAEAYYKQATESK